MDTLTFDEKLSSFFLLAIFNSLAITTIGIYIVFDADFTTALMWCIPVFILGFAVGISFFTVAITAVITIPLFYLSLTPEQRKNELREYLKSLDP